MYVHIYLFIYKSRPQVYFKFCFIYLLIFFLFIFYNVWRVYLPITSGLSIQTVINSNIYPINFATISTQLPRTTLS